ncbi:hypothetical protein NDU88_005073 [Pleurodeles waltl]|uniref:Reverse transcriptase/retrotransposon-derived protein RNase H-like domain-containing protein n=1 Tax=Pleurodeles waltl TaxID=8319 RepID=A0AAV7SKM5_PLEWA|nr:hypothetical protein NDU88_005073 [Pleurodeles waltl]
MKERITTILQMSPPKTRKEVRKFLGMVSYCRQWIPNLSTLAKLLLKLTQKDVQDEIMLKKDEMDAFIELKECMCRAPALGMPDYTKPFTLFCHKCDACSLSVLTQAHVGVNRPVAYFSATLDPVTAALQGCLRAAAAVGISLNQSEGIVMGHPVTVMVPHSVEILLTRSRTQHMTGARLTRYETGILGSPNVQLKRCTTLNPATFFPSENVEIENAEDIEHDFLQVTEFSPKPRPDIKDTRLEENDQIIFVDGSCLRDAAGILKAGYAVCTITGVLEASWLQGIYSAQEIEALKLPANNRKVPGTETERKEPESEQGETEAEEIFTEEDTVTPFEDNREEAPGADEGPISGEKAGEPSQRRAFPDTDDTGKEGEKLIDLPGEGDETEQRQIVPTLPEPVAGRSSENNAKRRQSISPVKSKTKETLNEDKRPDSKEKRKEVSIITTLNEEKDTAKEQDISEGESKGDAKFKRKSTKQKIFRSRMGIHSH